MKHYKVMISASARSDMEEIYTYIAENLQSPISALRQYNRIAAAIQKLESYPERCARVSFEPERTRGVRWLMVDNYFVFYLINQDSVFVVRVLYSASDINRRLSENKK